MTIYFVEMENTGAIKIGFTAADDPTRRIAQLQTGQPNKIKLIGCIPGDKKVERALHQEFENISLG